MGNLIRAEWYRLRQMPTTYLLLAGMILLTVVTASTLARPIAPKIYEILKLLMPCGVFFAIPCVLLAYGDQHRLGVLKNEVVCAIPRTHSYLSRLFVAVLLGLSTAAMVLVLFTLTCLLLTTVPPDWRGMEQLPQLLVGSAAMWVASAAILLALMTALRSVVTVVIVYFLSLSAGWPTLLVASSLCQDALQSGRGADWLNIFPWLYAVHPLSAFTINLSINATTPSAPLLDGTWGGTAQVMAIALAWTAISSALGILSLSRQEIK